MEPSEEYSFIVKSLKKQAKDDGKRLTNVDIAKRLRINPNYFATLTGGSGKVTEDHIVLIKQVFKDELDRIAGKSLKKISPDRALWLALLADYSKQQAKTEGIDAADIRDRIKKLAGLIEDGIDTFLSEL